jgi:hypothetical protein
MKGTVFREEEKEDGNQNGTKTEPKRNQNGTKKKKKIWQQ